MIDIHSHVLPGLDNGPSDIKETYEIIRELSFLGYIELVPTPHFFNTFFRSITPEAVRERISEVKKDIIKRFSFEYVCDIAKIRKLKNFYEFSSTEEGNRVILVEYSPFVSDSEIKSSIFSLNANGFKPVLAHIERYQKDDEFWINLKKTHKLFYQIGLKTLAKSAFRSKKQQAVRLLEKGIIDNLATDIHSISQLEKVEKGLEFFRKNFNGYEKDLFTDKF